MNVPDPLALVLDSPFFAQNAESTIDSTVGTAPGVNHPSLSLTLTFIFRHPFDET